MVLTFHPEVYGMPLLMELYMIVRVSLLEQLIPDSPQRPFARTMLRHFDKLTKVRTLRSNRKLKDLCAWVT